MSPRWNLFHNSGISVTGWNNIAHGNCRGRQRKGDILMVSLGLLTWAKTKPIQHRVICHNFLVPSPILASHIFIRWYCSYSYYDERLGRNLCSWSHTFQKVFVIHRLSLGGGTQERLYLHMCIPHSISVRQYVDSLAAASSGLCILRRWVWGWISSAHA